MNSDKLLFLSLILAVCLTQFASDIYMPSIPAIAVGLHTSVNAVQWSMAVYMLGVALSQLVYGPLSEGIGRKRPLLLGLGVMVIGSLLCLGARNITLLLSGRLIQGLGAGACAVLWRAIFRDVFTGVRLAQYGSYLTVAVMFIVPAAPVLGGYLQVFSGWRASFALISIYALLALGLVMLGFRETHHQPQRSKLKLAYVGANFRRLLTHPRFMGITVCVLLSYGGLFAWFTAAPVLLISGTNMSPVVFGWLSFAGGGVAYALSGWLNGRWVARYGVARMLRGGFSVMLFSSVLLWLGYYSLGMNAYLIAVPMILFYFGSTFIWPNAFAIAFTPFGDIAGYAGAVYGFMQVGGAALIGGIVSHLPDARPTPLAVTVLIASMLAWLVYELFAHRDPTVSS